MLLLREQHRRTIRKSLRAWCCHALKPLGQEPARHHDLLIRELERLARGEIDRLMVLMPPGSAKSKYASELFPAWWFIQNPTTAVIAASHTAELAERFGRRVRNLVAAHSSDLGYSLSTDSKAASRWETSAGGEYFAAGVGGSITGRRADLAIIDDPVSGKADAESETVRESTWNWYTNDLYTRLKPGARIIVIMTRWHEEDLGGRLLNRMESGGDKWTVIKLPAFAVDADDPLGRSVNEPLWPDWEDSAALARKRFELGERDFGALYQQDPRPAGTSFFEVKNALVDGEPVDYPPWCDAVFATLDTAVKTGSSNDGTAVCYWATSERGNHPLILLDWDIVQIEGGSLETWLPTVFQNLEALAKLVRPRFGSQGVYIEDKASGSVLLQQARRRGWDATEIESKLTAMGKDERAISVSGYIHRGMVKISRQAFDKVTVYKGRTANHLLTQVFRFRLGVKDQADDLLDSWCYAIIIALGNREGF